MLTKHRTYSVTGGAGSVRSGFTAGGGAGGCKSIWPTLWGEVVHGGEANLGERVVEAIRRAVDMMELVRGVTKFNWSLGVQLRHVSRTKVGENGMVVVPRGLPLELQLTVSPLTDAGPLSPPLPPAPGDTRPGTSASTPSTPVSAAAAGLHVHGWPVVARIDWPHGAATYLAFRGRPSTTREGEQHALVRVGPRSWSGPSSVGVSVGWLVGGNRAQDVKLEGGEEELGEVGVEFVAVTNVVQVQVRFL
ncbi:hypothetical protein BCR44DRAFT_1186842 [Catenaria anguillulae PL171]|uniref:Uncharacterized protein n=1 Tax=Catenaria anguillulae PL171 TaxID=765915 RepID=A0A1Y2HHA3_9FUNG|nr:hypothetical protein BCR44DRAFT_1186842 [Catenaria anguillulae PL171]